MSLSNFDQVFASLETGVEQLAKDSLKNYAVDAAKDGLVFIRSIKDDIEDWSIQVLAGEMDKDDLAFLIEGKKELLQMKAIQKKGFAKIQLDRFKSGLCDLLLKSILKLK